MNAGRLHNCIVSSSVFVHDNISALPYGSLSYDDIEKVVGDIRCHKNSRFPHRIAIVKQRLFVNINIPKKRVFQITCLSVLSFLFYLSINMVNIHIAGYNDFHCPAGRKVEEAVNAIRSMFVLIGGGIERNGEALFPNDTVTVTGDYHFVNFQPQQPQGISFFII